MTVYVFLIYLSVKTLSVFLWWRLVPRLGVRKVWLLRNAVWLITLLTYPLGR